VGESQVLYEDSVSKEEELQEDLPSPLDPSIMTLSALPDLPVTLKKLSKTTKMVPAPLIDPTSVDTILANLTTRTPLDTLTISTTTHEMMSHSPTCLDLDQASANPRTTFVSQLTVQQQKWITWRIIMEKLECLEFSPTSLTHSTSLFSKISLPKNENRPANPSLQLVEEVEETEETVQEPILQLRPQVTASLRQTRNRTLELERSVVEVREKHRELWEVVGGD